MALATVTAKETRVGLNLLRGTIPVPDGWAETALHLEDGGSPLPTEQRVVVRGPSGNTRVLELRAQVTSPGGPQTYTVETGAVASGGSFHANIAMTLACEDHEGTAYTATLLASGASSAPAGAVSHTERHSGELGSTNFIKLMGFEAFITTVAGEPDVFLVDMTLQNGTVDVTPLLHHLFFNEVRLTLPAGWSITHLAPNPHTSSTKLITPLGSGHFHAMVQGGMHDFRFAVHTAAAAGRASVLLSQSGFFVCDFSQVEWSWNNPLTSWYGPQAAPVPDIDLTGYLPYNIDYPTLKAAILTGSPAGDQFEFQGGKGFYSPWGPKNIDYVSGVQITAFLGYEIINHGRVNDLLMYMAVQGGITDRSTGVCIVDQAQTPIDCQNYDLTNLYFPAMGKFNTNGYGPFPRKLADQWRFNAVSAAGKLPWYFFDFEPADGLTGFSPADYAHTVRMLGPSTPLVWLYNDPLAKSKIGNTSAWSRFLMQEYAQGELYLSYQTALSWPGKGGVGGRFHGWQVFTIGTDYQLASDTKRANYTQWLTVMLAHLPLAQLPSGFWHATGAGDTPTKNLFDLFGIWVSASQAIENGIFSQGVRTLQVAVGGTQFPSLWRNMSSGLWNYHWKLGADAPHRIDPVRELNVGQPPGVPSGVAWSTQAAAPAAFTADTDNYQTAATVLFALMTNAAFVAPWQAVFAMTGTTDVVAAAAALEAQMPFKMADGWGALYAYLEGFGSAWNAGIAYGSSIGTGQISNSGTGPIAGLGYSGAIGIGRIVDDMTASLLAGVGFATSIGVGHLTNGSELQRAGPGSGGGRRGTRGTLVRR